MKKENNKPKCTNCQSGWVYTKEDGTRICRTCGHREQLKLPARPQKSFVKTKKRR